MKNLSKEINLINAKHKAKLFIHFKRLNGAGPSKAQAAAQSRREADMLGDAADVLDNILPASDVQPASVSARRRPRRATKRQITSLYAEEDGRKDEEYEPAECSHIDLGSQVLHE